MGSAHDKELEIFTLVRPRMQGGESSPEEVREPDAPAFTSGDELVDY